MDSDVILQAVLLLILLILSALFSSAETAMTTVNRIRIQALAEEGNPKALVLDKILDDSEKMLSAVLIGNNIVNTFAASLTTTLTISLFGKVYVGIATGVLTLFILIFGEISPKTLATLHSEKLALTYAPVVRTLMTCFTPIIFIINLLARGFIRLLGVDPDARPDLMTEQEFRTLVDVSEEEGVIESEEKEMINNVVDFGDSQAKDVMIPRIDMTFIDVDCTHRELMEVFRETMHTRFPVYEGTRDNVIGTINVKDLLLLPDEESFSIRNILRKPYFTYEHKATADLLLEMRKAAVNLAIVLDEYGSTSGLLTLEDLLEEIVGEIRDEYDEDEEEELKEIVPNTEYLVIGAFKLDDLNDALDIELESEDYDSIGGYFIEKLDDRPEEGQEITLENGIRLIAEKMDKNRIEKIRIFLPEDK